MDIFRYATNPVLQKAWTDRIQPYLDTYPSVSWLLLFHSPFLCNFKALNISSQLSLAQDWQSLPSRTDLLPSWTTTMLSNTIQSMKTVTSWMCQWGNDSLQFNYSFNVVYIELSRLSIGNSNDAIWKECPRLAEKSSQSTLGDKVSNCSKPPTLPRRTSPESRITYPIVGVHPKMSFCMYYQKLAWDARSEAELWITLYAHISLKVSIAPKSKPTGCA